ncbi:MAG: formate dehydrogenase accessory protein FdhE [Acidobacteriia bacterium]|nr:formate dehydrogenase accessory protein FdhE [Terriglobia bacterium]
MLFYARLAEFDGDAGALRELLMEHGPQLLQEAAREGREPALNLIQRVLRRRDPKSCTAHQPLAGVYRPEGDGTSFSLVCDACLVEYPASRESCPGCGGADRIAYYSAESMPHIQMRVCESCRRYLHVVNLGLDAEAIPEVDEMTALPLDIWAGEQGYAKLHCNFAGV